MGAQTFKSDAAFLDSRISCICVKYRQAWSCEKFLSVSAGAETPRSKLLMLPAGAHIWNDRVLSHVNRFAFAILAKNHLYTRNKVGTFTLRLMLIIKAEWKRPNIYWF